MGHDLVRRAPRLASVASLASLAVAASLVALTRPARAVDPFEIQVYDGTANAPGERGVELHVNRVFDGPRTAPAPLLPMHQQTHFTLEPSFGVTPYLELGGYFQTALRGDGTFDYAGSKGRVKLVLPGHEHLRLGLNFEISMLPARYDQNRLGGEVRPIIAWEDQRFLLAANPIAGVPLGLPDRKDGPTFEPAVMAKVKLFGTVAAGLEYYGDLGPIGSPLPLREEQHYLYEALDLVSWEHVELNAGIGEGLTSASSAVVAKMIFGYTWDAPEPARPAQPATKVADARAP